MFSAVLLTIGSVSAQQAFAGMGCVSIQNGDWDTSSTWDGCFGPIAGSNDFVEIFHNVTITGDEEASPLFVHSSGSIFIDCDASLTVYEGGESQGNITNHGTLTSTTNLYLFESTLFNSGDYSGIDPIEGGSIVEISTICDQPIGGTVGSMSTVSLLVAGAQSNMGWWAFALVGAVGAGVAIIHKKISNKTEE